MIQSWEEQGTNEFVTLKTIWRAYCPSISRVNPLFPACAGTRPRVGGVSDRSAVDRANTAAENPRGSGLSRSRLAPDAPADATDRDRRCARLRTCSCRVA